MSIPYRLANGVGNPADATKYMANYDWLTALIFGDFLFNGSLEAWVTGTSFTNPSNGTQVADNWLYTKSGSSLPTANVAREATIIDPSSGVYSAKISISIAGSADSMLGFSQATLISYFDLKGETVVFGMKVKCSTGSKVRLKLNDGVTSAYSNYHDGDGTFQSLQVTLSASQSAASLTASIEITSDFTGDVYFDSGYVFAIPPLMSATAKALLAFSKFTQAKLSTAGGTVTGDIVLSSTSRIVFTTPDGAHTYYFGIDNDGNFGTTPRT